MGDGVNDSQSSSQESNGSTKSYSSSDGGRGRERSGDVGGSSQEVLPDTQPMEEANRASGLGRSQSTPWAMLVAQSDHFENASIYLDFFKCGKERDCNYIIHKGKIPADCWPQFSRVHFQLERVLDPGARHYDVYLTDCSSNGTYVNSELVGKGKKRAITNKDVIALTNEDRIAFKFILIQDDLDSSCMDVPYPNSLPPGLLQEYVVGCILGKGACGSAYMAYSKVKVDEKNNPMKFCVKVIYRDKSLPPPPPTAAAAAASYHQSVQRGVKAGYSSSRGTLDSKCSKSEALGSDGTGEISRDSFQGIPVNSGTAAPTVAQSDSLLKPEIDILNHLKDRNKGHPNIIGYERTFECPSSIAIVFELAKGGELFDYIIEDFENNSFEEHNAKIQFFQILSGIKYLHDNDVCHRDLKLENILCAEANKKGLIKITDFGLSKLLLNNAPMTTYVGTPTYIAPEVMQNSTEMDSSKHSAYTVKADMWSLGCILFSLICGSPAFHSEKGDADLRRLIMAGEYYTDAATNPIWADISAEGKDLLANLLKVNPEERLSAGEALRHPWFDARTIQECRAIMKTGESGYFYRRNNRKDQSDVRTLLDSMELLDDGGRGRGDPDDDDEGTDVTPPPPPPPPPATPTCGVFTSPPPMTGKPTALQDFTPGKRRRSPADDFCQGDHGGGTPSKRRGPRRTLIS